MPIRARDRLSLLPVAPPSLRVCIASTCMNASAETERCLTLHFVHRCAHAWIHSHFFREEGNLDNLRTVQQQHKTKTRRRTSQAQR